MKIKITLLLLLIFIVLFFFLQKKSSCKNKQTILYKLENQNYCLLVADDYQEWVKGLMNYKKPVDFDGMIFIFPKKEIQNFWNMNTYLDLDIYWLDDKNIIGKSLLPSIKSSKNVVYVHSPKPANKVIEIIR